MWKKNLSILANQDLTNNSSDITDSVVRINVSGNANIWNIIKYIRNEDSLTALKLMLQWVTIQNLVRHKQKLGSSD